jgi:hypothetical protein
VLWGFFAKRPSEKRIIVGVNQRRAFREAFLSVCLPSLAVWLVVAFVLDWQRKVSYADGLPVYLFLFLLPFPLIYPIYRRYLKGPQPPTPRSRRYHFVWAALCGAMSIFSIATALPAFRHHKGLGDWSQLTMALFWVSMCIDHLYSASKAESDQSSSRV